MNYVGIDYHRQYSHLTVMDQQGQVLRSGRVANLRSEIEKFLGSLETMEAVIETGRSSYAMVDVLGEIGLAVKIAHPFEVKAIARAKIKTDKRDSEVLAHLLRMNMIPEVYQRSPENRKAQRVLRQRAFYVSAMTALKNRVYALLAQQKEEVRERLAQVTNIFSVKRPGDDPGAGSTSGRQESSRGTTEDVPALGDKDQGVDGTGRKALRADPGGSTHPNDPGVRKVSVGPGRGGDRGLDPVP